MIDSINIELKKKNGIPTTEITLQKLADEAQHNVSERVGQFMKRFYPDESSFDFPEPPAKLLAEYKLDPIAFRALKQIANKNYQQYMQRYNSRRQWGSLISRL